MRPAFVFKIMFVFLSTGFFTKLIFSQHFNNSTVIERLRTTHLHVYLQELLASGLIVFLITKLCYLSQQSPFLNELLQFLSLGENRIHKGTIMLCLLQYIAFSLQRFIFFKFKDVVRF